MCPVQVALLLIAKGADIDAKDAEEGTALTLATAEEMKSLLRSAAQQQSQQSQSGSRMETD